MSTGKDKKVTGLMEDELGGKILRGFPALRPKTYFYLMDDGKDDKKSKGTMKCVTKGILKFNDYSNCLMNNKAILKSRQDLKVKLVMYILKKSIRLH